MLQNSFHIIDFADDYLHDLLRAGDAAYVERHCETCAMCKAALEEARKRQSAMETVPANEAAEELVKKTLGRIVKHEQKRSRIRKYIAWGVFAPGAAAALILTILNIYYLRLTPTPYDLAVLGQNQLLCDAFASLRVRLIDRNTGLAVAGAPVQLRLRDPKRGQTHDLATFTTDTQGTGAPRFRVPDWPEGSYELVVSASPGGTSEQITRPIKLERAWKLMLSSDKPVYQPGQEIHIRSLSLRRPDLKPLPGQSATFTITDPKGNMIFKKRDATSKFGIASSDCPLATEITEGTYTIACKIGETESKLAVEVKKYVLPKFKIDIDLDEPYYKPGQRVKCKLHAAYFFGKPVAGGEVKIKAVPVSALFPLKEPIANLKARTDPSGDASFDFVLPEKLFGREQDSGDARISIEATVADSAGQEQSRTVSRTVTAQELRIEVIPEGGTIVRGVPNTIYFYVSYPDGRPAPRTRLAITSIGKELTTNELGIAFAELPDWSPDLPLSVKAMDEKGRVAQRTIQLPTGPAGFDFLIRTDKAVYKGGETMQLTALGAGVEPVFVDLIKDGQTMLTETVAMSNGKGTYQLDIPADLFGTVELHAYRYGAAGLPVRKSRVLYIHQPGQVNIKAVLDREEYRPGSKARLKLFLTDLKGKPAPGAVSLAAVDEAVYSVLAQAPGMEKTFYTLEQKLLQPVYAIYSWSPDFSAGASAEEQNRLEQAIFSRTASSPPPAPPEGGVNNQSPPFQGGARGGYEGGPGRSESGPHSLEATSFPEKVQEVSQRRETGLGRVKTGWLIFGIALTIGLCISFGFWAGPAIADKWETWSAIREADGTQSSGIKLLVTISVFSVAFFLLVLCLLTSVQKAREASVSGMARNRAMMGLDAPQEWEFAKPGEPIGKLIYGLNAGPEPTPIRTREWFPETLLWKPELVTNDQGEVSIDIPLADSITTWRLSASAVTAAGQLGAMQQPIKVFQPFFVDLNLPVALTRNDKAAIPIVVYNYLDKAQTVTLDLKKQDWFELQGDNRLELKLGPGEVRSVAYRLQAKKVGSQSLEVAAKGDGDEGDAVKRAIEVVPDGLKVEQVANGTLQRPLDLPLDVPANAIDGSPKAILKVYPSSFSQLVEGLDSIFQMPYGCFEQTSSTTYPNILALDYLRQTKKSVPEVEAKARQYIHLGYQRLIGFEVQGGGFDWFGRPPANRTLTAYGLMEFQDMARVHDVDPKLIERTRQWLLSQRKADGSWPADRGMGSVQRGNQLDLASTAYVAWAVWSGQKPDSSADVTRRFLLAHKPGSINDPYILALTCNAMLALDASGTSAKPYLDRLETMKKTSPDGKLCWWEQPGRTTFYGSGKSGNVETTALAVLALLQSGNYPATARGGLSWIAGQKDGQGNWHSTQATVLALKALVVGAGKPLGGGQERRVEIALGGKVIDELVITKDQDEVMKMVDLSKHLKPGLNPLQVRETTGTGAGYQLAFHYHVPGKQAGKNEPLAIDIAYDRSELVVNDTLSAKATVVNQMAQAAPMVILDLPIPAGFALIPEGLAKLQAAGTIAKFQPNARTVVVYLRGLEPGKPLELSYQLKATMPVEITVPAARVYEYYDPDKQGRSRTSRLTVAERK